MSGGTRIFGIAASENPDKSGEIIKIAGIDVSGLRWFNDEHQEPTSLNLGYITGHKKIMSEKDCENPKQLRCWNLVKVPFLYAEGELFDNEEHPFAQATASIIKFASQNPEYRVPIGLSIEGGIMERQNVQGQPVKDPQDGKILAQTVATKATITVKPCNPNCHVFLENDLAKSAARVPPPANLNEIMAAPESRSSIKENLIVKTYFLAEHLKKSIMDYRSGMTSMRCLSCNKSYRFFKDTKEIPNQCTSCGFKFTLRDIWSALNK